MSAKSHWRGHSIYYDRNSDIWRYESSYNPVPENINIECGHCGLPPTEEGHDGCLNTLKGVMNACCGHGIEGETYVQFLDGFSIYGKDAKVVLEILKKYREVDYEI